MVRIERHSPTAEILSQPDPRDPTCLDYKTRGRINVISKRLHSGLTSSDDKGPDGRPVHKTRRKYTIGFPVEYNIEELDPVVRRAWLHALGLLEAEGHVVVPVSLPSTKAALAAYYVLAPAEASSNLAKYDGVRFGPRAYHGPDGKPPSVDDTQLPPSPPSQSPRPTSDRLYAAHRGTHFGPEVQRRILLGTFSLSSAGFNNYFIQAQKIRRQVQSDFDLVFRMPNPLRPNDPNTSINSTGVDFLLCPTAPTPPPLLSTITNQDPVQAYTADVFTVPASLAGLPAISFPMSHGAGSILRPETMVGMQVIGQYGDDDNVIKFVRREFEDRESWRRIVGVRKERKFK